MDFFSIISCFCLRLKYFLKISGFFKQLHKKYKHNNDLTFPKSVQFGFRILFICRYLQLRFFLFSSNQNLIKYSTYLGHPSTNWGLEIPNVPPILAKVSGQMRKKKRFFHSAVNLRKSYWNTFRSNFTNQKS